MNKGIIYKRFTLISLLCWFCILCSSCKKSLEIDTSNNQLLASQVFASEASANSAIVGIYRTLKDRQFGSISNITLLTGLASDELYNYTSNSVFDDYRNNAIRTDNAQLPWAGFYNVIYQANAAVEGLESAKAFNGLPKNQYLGEAKFIRAFCYFYLVNLFGEVPLLTTTNITITATASRSSAAMINAQIAKDLQEAVSLLSDDYFYSGGDRVRANKWAATALLSRFYLYSKDWVNAEKWAGSIINSNKYSLLPAPQGIFKLNNAEAIFQFADTKTESSYEPIYFIFSSSPNIICSNFLLNAFESGDLRKTKWINAGVYSGQTYYYPYKFTTTAYPSAEVYTLFRLGEQYLIRAEARAMQSNLGAGLNDLNLIRQRAGLNDIPATITQTDLLAAIAKERQTELFAESGHRWLDLKRTGKIDQVLGLEKPTTWKPWAALFPLPLAEIQKNASLTQNQGY